MKAISTVFLVVMSLAVTACDTPPKKRRYDLNAIMQGNMGETYAEIVRAEGIPTRKESLSEHEFIAEWTMNDLGTTSTGSYSSGFFGVVSGHTRSHTRWCTLRYTFKDNLAVAYGWEGNC